MSDRPGTRWYALPMPVKCPVCETTNSDDAAECGDCGKILFADADLVVDVAPIEGLEETLHDPLESATGPVAMIPELERTQIEADPDAVSFWGGGVDPDLDLGREPADGQRTPAPQDTGLCPWCTAPATGAVCDNCGRRRSRSPAGRGWSLPAPRWARRRRPCPRRRRSSCRSRRTRRRRRS